MSRNVFENNTPEISSEDVKSLGGEAHWMLPPLEEGLEYELHKLQNGRTLLIAKRS